MAEGIAGAIDAKSPYTGGHCQRVPELTLMLARSACEATEGPLREFSMNADEWEALQIAAWLHDCGKVTTPEYVVDKATKLETIYDRIHEIRMRFEVLKRDAEIEYLREVAAGADAAAARSQCDALTRTLDEELRYVLDRRGQKKFPGNMLDRPALLLNPWMVRSTESGEQLARPGDDFDRKAQGEGGRGIGEGSGAGVQTKRTAIATPNLDFLAEAAAVLLNLVPDKDGVVRVKRADLGSHAMIHVLAVDPLNPVN